MTKSTELRSDDFGGHVWRYGLSFSNVCMRPEFMTSMSCDSVYCMLGAVADWWRSWPMANAFACLCMCQWLTFWTYFVTINLFSPYLMNFMFHTMLDAACNIQRVHYKVWNVMFSFSLGSVSTLLRWGGLYKIFLPGHNSAKIIKIDQDFPELWLQMYCLLPPFYDSQCIVNTWLPFVVITVASYRC